MASLAATNWPKPLVVVPCLSWSTASSVFTEGVMSDAINWDLLQTQYFSDSKFYNILSKQCTIVDDPFECTLSLIPEYAVNCVNTSMIATKMLTPYEVLSSLNSTLSSNCAALSYKESDQKRNSILNMKTVSLLRTTPSLFSKTSGYSEMKRRDKEGVIFMRGIMDEFTHLKNFSVPVDTSLVISVCARSDAYVPRQGCSKLEDLWPGVTVRYLDSGHVGAYLWHRKVFRSAIVEAFERAKAVCPPPKKFRL